MANEEAASTEECVAFALTALFTLLGLLLLLIGNIIEEFTPLGRWIINAAGCLFIAGFISIVFYLFFAMRNDMRRSSAA